MKFLKEMRPKKLINLSFAIMFIGVILMAIPAIIGSIMNDTHTEIYLDTSMDIDAENKKYYLVDGSEHEFDSMRIRHEQFVFNNTTISTTSFWIDDEPNIPISKFWFIPGAILIVTGLVGLLYKDIRTDKFKNRLANVIYDHKKMFSETRHNDLLENMKSYGIDMDRLNKELDQIKDWKEK